MSDTAYDSYPTVRCRCGTSLHDSPGNRRAHEDEWHSPEIPADYQPEESR